MGVQQAVRQVVLCGPQPHLHKYVYTVKVSQQYTNYCQLCECGPPASPQRVWPFAVKLFEETRYKVKVVQARRLEIGNTEFGKEREVKINPLNAELNPICHLLALLGGATIVVVSRLRVKYRGQTATGQQNKRINRR